MNKKNNIYTTYISIYGALILLFASCANIVTPSGGPRDTKPPRPIKSIPANYSSQFNRNKIEILFDEFILLRDLKNQMLISPPLNEMPDIKAKGKTLVIEIKEKLKENTTYTIFFGDAIIDLTEGNALSAYEFVFSTGNSIDSMTFTGNVADAFTLKPEKDFYVMLYDKIYDSVPYKEKPYYLAKTRENGDYTLNNLRNIPYKIFVLKDINNNFKFDQPTEKIAFADSLIVPHIKPLIVTDSAHKDSLLNDSLNVKPEMVRQLSLTELRTFLEIDSTQRLLKAGFIKKGQLLFAFRYPLKKLNVKVLDKIEDNNWKIEEWNVGKDTLIYWILNPEIDSLNLIIDDNNQFTDTLNLHVKQKTSKVTLTDTINVRIKQKNTKSPLNSITKIFPFTNITQPFDFYKSISFTFPNPVLKYDSLAVLIINENDTLISFAYNVDGVHRKFLMKNILKQNQEYKLVLKENLVTDIFGLTNDSIVIKFKTNTIEDFGNFKLNVNLKDTINSCIIQLLSEGEEILEEKFIDKDTQLVFKNLTPGTYLLKAIIDENKNKRWDTGNYLRKIQPERILNYSTKITIRANWDLEENWKL